MSDEIRKEDRRVVFTKMILRQSMFEIIKEKPVDKITVTELCRKAGINRNTFYTHYSSPRDVLGEIQNEFTQQLLFVLGNNITGSVHDIVCEIFNVISQNKELCKIFFSSHGDSEFVNNIILSCKGKVLDEWKKTGIRIPHEKSDMIFSFIVEGSLAVIKYWILNDIEMSYKEISELINTLTNNGIGSFNEK